MIAGGDQRNPLDITRAELRRQAAYEGLYQLISDGRIATAQRLSSEALQSKLITPADYIALVRLSEGR